MIRIISPWPVTNIPTEAVGEPVSHGRRNLVQARTRFLPQGERYDRGGDGQHPLEIRRELSSATLARQMPAGIPAI
jgi:hypothetical protein